MPIHVCNPDDPRATHAWNYLAGEWEPIDGDKNARDRANYERFDRLDVYSFRGISD